MPPPCTTIAGRHAADRQRERDRAQQHEVQQDRQDHARRELDRALTQLGFTTHPHFERGLESERSLWVNCRVQAARTDHELVYAVLDAQGWRPDIARLSRLRQSHDILRLRHRATGASLVVIIKVPFGHIEPLEAA